jgi:adenine-specific DNA-methyltransferase
VAFENHLNVLHHGGGGLDRDLAHGLCWWLNSSLVDKFFRTFSGHTQANAADLRTLRFPAVETLRGLGAEVSGQLPNQENIDARVNAALSEVFSVVSALGC